jgi:uncharacterized protein (DUF952 family)
MRDADPAIYHLALEDALRTGLADGFYAPADLAETGFVHCSTASAVLPVARDYFAGVPGRLLVIEIDPKRLTSEVRYEAPAPVDGAGRAHLSSAPSFPHVYGPIDRAAITGVGLLRPTDDGYAWPETFGPLESLLGSRG